MLRLMILLALASCAGCGATPPTKAHGRPITQWVEALKSSQFRGRKTAVEALGNVGPNDPAALPALAAALKDTDPRIRDAAVLAIMKSGPEAAAQAPEVRALLDDPDPGVRAHAAAALKRIEPDKGR